ncbi:MAG: DEAD/DEAH box helicase family protein [Deltaproteobacteria bacterium]|nr:DEAD/DEAH box helicase family protein [Deltaproteobacteria bacterium]
MAAPPALADGSAPRAILDYAGATLVYDGDPAGAALLGPLGFVPDPRIANRLRAPGRLYRQALAALVKAGLAVDDRARAYAELDLVHRRSREPHPHQQEALDAWVGNGRRGVVVLPTGAGKSYVAEMAILQVRRSTLVVAPTIDLMNQWVGLLESAFGPELVGSVGGGTHRLAPLTATTYDSAHLHVESLGARFGLVVFDECHHLPSPAYALAAEGLIAPFRLGLTATPERGDGGEARLLELVGRTVYRKDIQDLEGTYLARYETVRVPVELTAAERQAYDAARATYRAFVERSRIAIGAQGGWARFLQAVARAGAAGREAFTAWRAQRRIAMGGERKLEVLASLFAEHPHDPTIIFCADKDTVHLVSRRWLVPALTHETPGPERKQVLDDFNAGRVRAIVTARVLNEGVDLPAASVGIVLAGTATVREHVQRLGRILRKQGDKEAVLYEIVTAGTSEEAVSERRREHGAYR